MTVRLDIGVTDGVSYDNNDKPVYTQAEPTATQKKYQKIFNDLKHPKLERGVQVYTYKYDGFARSSLPVIKEECEKQPVSER